jgi:hypothetical protein
VSYVAALTREGDNFDYHKWLQNVREEEAQAARVFATISSYHIKAARSANPISVPGFSRALPNRALTTRTVPLAGLSRSRIEPGDKLPKAQLRRRLEAVGDAWDDFQGNRARDAVYGYLEAVFAIVSHYRTRRKTDKLLRHAFQFASLSCDKNADAFTAVIRCTSDNSVDNKMISKWARALRYVASCKVRANRLKAFMKDAGGVNACADKYAKVRGRGAGSHDSPFQPRTQYEMSEYQFRAKHVRSVKI